MHIPMHSDLEKAVTIFNDGKLEEALDLIKKFEQLEGLNLEDEHFCRFVKGNILLQMGRLQESLKLADQDYQESKNQNKPLYIIDSVFSKWGALFILGRGVEEWEDIELCEKLLNSVSEELPVDVALREGCFYYMKGYFNYWKHNYDEAIEYLKKSRGIFEQFDIMELMVPYNLNALGHCYEEKGELDLALKFHKESLDLSKNRSIIEILANGSTYNNIGQIFFQKGDLDQAIEYYEKSLKTLEKYLLVPAINWVGITYFNLIKLFIYKNSFKEAQKYLILFNEYLNHNKLSINLPWYRISKAAILRSSTRIRERAEAEQILKFIVERYKNAKVNNPSVLAEEFTIPLLELCDFYLEELRLTNDLNIIDDINPLILRLLKESERTNSFLMQAQVNLLYGKISLLQMNMGDARRYLTKAQQISEEHGLQLLAREISTEHDKMLEQLSKWESLNNANTPISELMEFASLKESFELLLRRRAIEPPKLADEEPVLLLIIAEGGILLFSYPFSDVIKIEDELFGGFLSAFSSFSDEVLSEGLDRARFGQYTVLIKNIADFSFCYLFKGQTYLAQKKLFNFTENFQKNSFMMETLNRFHQASQVIEVTGFPFLEGLIKGIFVQK